MLTTTDDSSQTLLPDSLIDGRFRVVRLLGKGGMGAVYEARNTLKRRFAIKVMRPEVARNTTYARRFLQEAQAASQLAHPNIVDVFELGEDKNLGVLYIVQEFLSGYDLRSHLDAAGRMPVRQALGLIVPVMEALVMAHGHGIVHRDLKPDNIFLAETARGVVPKLIDFGIAKVVGDDGYSSQETADGTLLGTPFYLSPEQGRGDTALDARSDVWSLGVVLYEMLSGTRPCDAANSNALIAKIIYEDPKPLAEAAPDLPADLVAAVMGALQRDLTNRHPTMQAFLDAICGCAVVRDGGLSAASIARPEGVATSGPLTTPVLPSQPTVAPRVGGETFVPRVETLPPDAAGTIVAPRRSGWKVAVGAVLILGLAAIVASSFHGAAVVARPASTLAPHPSPVAVPVTSLAAQSPSAPAQERAVIESPASGRLVAPPAPATPIVAPVRVVSRPTNVVHRATQQTPTPPVPEAAPHHQHAAHSSHLNTGIPVLPP